jgi:UDP-3-O-[3-hydroxymyristoyl] N-acetylglucosamine deacetylase / 3-hydroxyacyl-[acyl-carrier-protein] dehydratase
LSQQKTIREPAIVQGRSLFSGAESRVRFLPAPEGAGLAFVRDDLPSPQRIPCRVEQVAKRARRTSLAAGGTNVETVEHVLSAVWGCGIDNLAIEVNAEEPPSPDGSPLPFAQALLRAGLQEQQAEQEVFVIREPVNVRDGDAMLAALPGPADCLEIIFDLDDPRMPSIGRQVIGFRLGKDDFISQIAPARTFLLEQEAAEQQARGFGRHLKPSDVLVMTPTGPMGDNTLRFPDEHARHKVADLIGDLALLGKRLRGRIVAYKSGHELNHALVRSLLEGVALRARAEVLAGEPVMDIRKIMRLLKHRYPCLMVDRVIRMEADRHAVAIKNVSINEPYFQGHYPGQPIMPGVMILEAMAQLSGILLSQRLEHTGKIAVLLSMDRVKMRRAVRPGDQLVLEAEALHVRTRTGHCRCRAYVGADMAAEAEIKFMLVDDEPV